MTTDSGGLSRQVRVHLLAATKALSRSLSDAYILLLSTTGSALILDLLLLLSTCSLLLLRLCGLLFLHSLHFTILDLLLAGVVLLLSVFAGLGLLSLDVIEGHSNDSLLDLGGLPGTSLGGVINLDFLVELSPGGGPGQFNWFDLLVE